MLDRLYAYVYNSLHSNTESTESSETTRTGCTEKPKHPNMCRRLGDIGSIENRRLVANNAANQMGSREMSKPKKVKQEVITAFKGFDKHMKCLDFQFEVGKTYVHDREVKACSSGFHACEYPLDVFRYYAPADSVFAIVDSSGEIDRETNGDTKIASAELYIKGELKIPELTSATIKWITDKCDSVKAQHSKGDRSASSATGNQSASSATGNQSASSATGYRSASSATGYQSASSATGYQSASSATDDRSASSATGNRSASSATGNRSASSATGYQSASSATGYQSASSATGNQSASSATGNQSASSAMGKNSVAMNIGIFGKAKADKDGAIVLCNHDSDYNIRHIRASKIGENGIKANTWYQLNDAGEFVECE